MTEQAVFSLDAPGIQTMSPSSGWNASFSSQDRLRWANLCAFLLRNGTPLAEAEQYAHMMTYKIRLHVTYSARQERDLKRAFSFRR